MPSLPDVVAALERIAPERLAAEWDSVGLLVAPRDPQVRRALTCLTLTPEVAAEAVRARIDLVITHHPLPFRPIGRITPETGTGRVLLTLVGSGCGVWSSHTAWDSAAGGINEQLAALIGLAEICPIAPDASDPAVGFGRMGSAPGDPTVAALARLLAGTLDATGVQIVGDRRADRGRPRPGGGPGGHRLWQRRRSRRPGGRGRLLDARHR